MHEATFRVEGRGDFPDITRRTDATIELWCNDHCDLLRVRGAARENIGTEIDELTGVHDSITEGHEEVIITENCLERHEVTMIDTFLSRHDCLMLPPLSYNRGFKTCRVLALNPEKLTAFYRDILNHTSVVVEAKREIDAVEPKASFLGRGGALPSLSPRQREVLLIAHELGYYEIPRRTRTKEIGEVVGVERRTAEQHLRRAENKIIDELISSNILL